MASGIGYSLGTCDFLALLLGKFRESVGPVVIGTVGRGCIDYLDVVIFDK